MAEAVRLQLEVAGVPGPTRRKLFSSFVEMAQNIIHYSADALTPPHQDDGELRHGAVCIRREDDGSFVLLCANPIEPGMGEAARQARRPAQHDPGRDQEGLPPVAARRRARRQQGRGHGFLTLARDAREPLQFDFDPAQTVDGRPVFYLKATL